MENKTLAKNIFLLAVVFSIIHSILYYSFLPQYTAVHFDLFGKPDNYANKDLLLFISIGITLFMLLLFTGISRVAPRIQNLYINLPNKNYWLKKDKRLITFSIISAYSYWIGTITLIFLLITYNQVYKVNLKINTSLNVIFWLGLILYLFAVIYLCIKMYYRFSKINGTGYNTIYSQKTS